MIDAQMGEIIGDIVCAVLLISFTAFAAGVFLCALISLIRKTIKGD